MTISGGTGPGKVLRAYLGRLKGGGKVKVTSPKGEDKDRVTLSPEVQQAARIREALKTAAIPASRQATVQALKDKVQRGEYRVPSHELAENILRENPAVRPE